VSQKSLEKQTIKIFCVDDEADILRYLEMALGELRVTELPLEIFTFTDPTEALNAINNEPFNIALIFCDLIMPGMDGLRFRENMLTDHSEIPFILGSGHIDDELALRASELEIAGIIRKPFLQEEILQVVTREITGRVEMIKEDRELLSDFLTEASPQIEELEQIILGLEGGADLNAIDRVFGIVHTIKGLSGFFKPNTINVYSHHFESYLGLIKSGRLIIDSNVINVLLTACDHLTEIFEALKYRGSSQLNLSEIITIFEEGAIGEREGASPDSASTLSPSDNSSSLDPSSSEETLTKGGAQTQTAEMAANTPREVAVRDWVKAPVSVLNDFVASCGEISILRNLTENVLGNMESRFHGEKTLTELKTLFDEMNLHLTQLQNSVIELKKVSVKEVFRPLQRMVRDLANLLEKSVELVVVDNDLRVDSSIGEVLSSCMIHIIRNCLDHGLEGLEERKEGGKNLVGRITITVNEFGQNIEVTIADDGRGVDPERVGQKLLEKEILDQEELQRLSDNEIIQYIFSPGFSTAAELTSISGRGVGMDQVKSQVESMGGSISISSQLKIGTSFQLIFPRPDTINIVNTLMVTCDQLELAIPLDFVNFLHQVDQDRNRQALLEIEGRYFLKNQTHPKGPIYPIVSLEDLLENRGPTHDFLKKSIINIVIIKVKDRSVGLVVDEILRIQESVAKDLPDFLKSQTLSSQVTYLADGHPGLILDITKLAQKTNFFHTRDSLTQEKYQASQELIYSNSLENPNDNDETGEFVLFNINPGPHLALQLEYLYRFEQVWAQDITRSGDSLIVQYNQALLPLFFATDILTKGPAPYLFRNSVDSKAKRKEILSSSEPITLLVVRARDRQLGLVVDEVVDIAHLVRETVEMTKVPQYLGHCTYHEKTYFIVKHEALLNLIA
jgi:two-component system, chemotaxis family, sensor kinase CheA